MKITQRVFLLCLLVPLGCADEVTRAPTCIDRNVEPSVRPDIPLLRQTEHLDIHAEGFVCAGTAAEFERHVAFVSAQLGIDLREHIPVYVYEDSAEPCRYSKDGCVARDGAVFTTPLAAYHDLGKSTLCQLRSNAQLGIAEGIATMFEPDPQSVRMHSNDVLFELIELSSDLYYHHAGHILRWLYEREGADAIAELYRRSSDDTSTTEAIQDIFGASMEQLDADYFATAPYQWVPFRQCADVPHVERDDDGVWRHSSIIDCESESTMGPYLHEQPDILYWLFGGDPNVMFQSFTFTIEQETHLDYELHGDIEFVLLWRCGDENPSSDGNDVFEYGWITPKDWIGNQSHPDLRPGTWRADVLVTHGPAAPIAVSFWEDPELP